MKAPGQIHTARSPLTPPKHLRITPWEDLTFGEAGSAAASASAAWRRANRVKTAKTGEFYPNEGAGANTHGTQPVEPPQTPAYHKLGRPYLWRSRVAGAGSVVGLTEGKIS